MRISKLSDPRELARGRGGVAGALVGVLVGVAEFFLSATVILHEGGHVVAARMLGHSVAQFDRCALSIEGCEAAFEASARRPCDEVACARLCLGMRAAMTGTCSGFVRC